MLFRTCLHSQTRAFLRIQGDSEFGVQECRVSKSLALEHYGVLHPDPPPSPCSTAFIPGGGGMPSPTCGRRSACWATQRRLRGASQSNCAWRAPGWDPQRQKGTPMPSAAYPPASWGWSPAHGFPPPLPHLRPLHLHPHLLASAPCFCRWTTIWQEKMMTCSTTRQTCSHRHLLGALGIFVCAGAGRAMMMMTLAGAIYGRVHPSMGVCFHECTCCSSLTRPSPPGCCRPPSALGLAAIGCGGGSHAWPRGQ